MSLRHSPWLFNLRIGVIKDGLQDIADGAVAAVQLAFQPTISTESGPQNG